jgi:acid phosphatase family membrane protein YuiD
MIVVATWPMPLRLQRTFGGRPSLAAAAMTALLFAIGARSLGPESRLYAAATP